MGKMWRWLIEQYKKNSQLINIAIVASVAHLAYGVLNQSAIPPYVAAVHLTAYIGYIYGTYLVMETLVKTPAGSLEDIIGMRPVYVVVTVIGGVSAFLWTLTRNLGVILAIRVVDGAASAGVWTATVVAMGDSVSRRGRTSAMSAFTVTYLGGLALGPLIGGFANDVTHSKLTAFYVAGVLFGIASIAAYFLIPKNVAQSSDEALSQPGSRLSLLQEVWLGLRSVPDYMLIAFFAFLSFGLIIPIIKLFAMQQLGMTETQYGLTVVPVAGFCAIASIASGRIANIWGKATSVHVGIGLGAAMMYLVPLIHANWMFGVLAGLIGLGFIVGMPPWLAMISDMADPNVRGSVVGAVGTGQGLGIIVGVLLGGYLYDAVPFHLLGINLNSHYTPFIACALGLTVTFLLSLIFVREGTGRHITVED